MKILFLCGVFAKENEQEVLDHAKMPIEYSANIFQEKLITGFEQIGVDYYVLSAPFIGAFPKGSDIFKFKGFPITPSKYEYVTFCNIWGIRNFSRAKALKHKINNFIQLDEPDKLIVVYSPHTPFLEAAVYAKKKDSRIKINLIVPDLPQYMNLNAKISLLYKVGKRLDIAKFNRLNREVDSYVLLTDAMKDMLNVGTRPYFVAEGIIDDDIFEKNEHRKKELQLQKEKDKTYIVYTGKITEKFGVKALVDSFIQLKDPTYRLVLCGCGDLMPEIQEKKKIDPRIIALGQVTPDVAHDWILKADILVNPRPNNEEYTKYSFPSKNIEYLASGNPVMGYLLHGMKNCYHNFIYEILNEDILSSIQKVRPNVKSYNLFVQYAVDNLSASKIVRKIINMGIEI